MPIKDNSLPNIIFQQQYNTEISLAEVFRFLSQRDDFCISDYASELNLNDWAIEHAQEEGYAELSEIPSEDLVGELQKRLSSDEIVGLLDDEDIVEVSTKSVEWLVETLMERSQAEVEQYLEIHGFVRSK